MNERIKELAKLATHRAIWPGDPDAGKLDAEVFAELLVRECLKRVESKANRWGNMTDEIVNRGILECAEDLKQHFGVEE